MKFPQFVILILLPSTLLAQGTTPVQQQRRLTLPAITQTELVSVPLDTAAYQHLADDLHDLRLLDSTDQEIAYVLKRRTAAGTEKVRQTWFVNNPQLQPSATTGLSIRFELEDDQPIPNSLLIVTPLQNFEQSVQLFGVVDGNEVELVRGDVIFDYQRYMNVRRTTIAIPATTARSFRLVIDSLTSEQESMLLGLTRELQTGTEVSRQERFSIERRPFRIDQLELAAESQGLLPAQTSYPVNIVATTQDAKRQETTLEISSQREPLTRLSVNTSSKNFSRPVRLEVEDDQQVRRVIQPGTLSSIDVRSIHETHLQLNFAPSRESRYFLVIANADNAPLEITGIEAHGEVDDVYFLVEPNQQVRLVYGLADVPRPSYDTAALSAALHVGEPPLLATLGAVEVATITIPVRPLELRDLWNNPVITGPLILLLMGFLGWGLYRAAARIEAETVSGTEASETESSSTATSATANEATTNGGAPADPMPPGPTGTASPT